MRTLVIADLRHSIRIWAGSLLVLAVSQLCAMWVAGLLVVGATNVTTMSGDTSSIPPVTGPDGTVIPPEVFTLIPAGIVSATSISFVVLAVVASITVRNVVNAIVYQRRRVMALWQLAGMTEAQLLRILRGQIALLSIVAFVAAGASALLTADWILSVLRAAGLLFTPPMTTGGLYLGYGIGAVMSILISILAVRGTTRELRAISPLEAIRSEGVRELSMTRRRWVSVMIWGALCVVLAIGALASQDLEGASSASLIAALVGIVALNAGGPVIMVALMSAWTRLVPEHLSASWFLARKTLQAATARSVATIGSISIAVFLFTALFSQQTAGGGESSVAGFVLVVGFPLAISVSGSVVLVFMAGQQRESEIHLAELAGATPAQQKRQAFSEAVMVVVTGSGIGLLLSVFMMLLMQPALIASTGAADLHVSWGHFALISGILLVLNIVATVVPTMIAQAARERIAVPE